MKDAIYLLFHLLTTVAKLLRAGGGKTIIAENLLLKQQLIIHSRAVIEVDDSPRSELESFKEPLTGNSGGPALRSARPDTPG